MFNDWNELEDFVAELLKFDNGMRTPLSGGTKKEEDVVGGHSIAQCKYTENKNMSILDKDLDRLLNTAHMLEKFPLFVTANQKSTIISVPYTENTKEIILMGLQQMIALKIFENLCYNIERAATEQDISRLNKHVAKCDHIMQTLNKTTRDAIKKVKTRLEIATNKIMMHDLFENVEENNGSK